VVYYNGRCVITLLLTVFSQTFSVNGTARCVSGFLESDTFILGYYIQGVPGGMCQTSEECSLGQTIPI